MVKVNSQLSVMTSARAYVDADVAVMTSAMTLTGDPAARGVHEARGSIFTKSLDGAWGRVESPMKTIFFRWRSLEK